MSVDLQDLSEVKILSIKQVMTEDRLAKQSNFILEKLAKSKLFDKYSLTLVDSNEVIIQSLNGELRNIVQSFFKGGMYAKRTCEHCGSTTAAQYERAHDKSSSRGQVAMAALARIRPDEGQIRQSDFMRAFIEEHRRVPLWVLCKPCHKTYDSDE
jgi:hypothetical protein